VALEWKDVVTDLGLLIDGRLRFGRHVTKICSKVYTTLHRLPLLQFLTPKQVRLNFARHFFFRIFFYCDVIFSRLSSVDGLWLQVSFNSCTRYVFNLRRFDNLSVNRNAVLDIPLFEFFDFHVLSFMGW
jgi:hypothetical protein